MNLLFIVGVLGALVLVTGAAWPMKKVEHPGRSVKNWLFAVGAGFMLFYSFLNYYMGVGEVFFVFLQVFVVVASVLMLGNVNKRVYVPVVASVGGAFVLASLFLFEGFETASFVLGLVFIGVGYLLKNGTALRNFLLFLGSVLIVMFSYFVKDWIFVWLNVFFAIFSGYYALKLWRK